MNEFQRDILALLRSALDLLPHTSGHKKEMRLIADDKAAVYYREMSAVGLGFNFKEIK